MSKKLTPLEHLERIKNITYDRTDLYGIEEYRKSLDIIETALKELEFYQKRDKQFKADANRLVNKIKVLEIIKEKQVDIHYLMICFTDKFGNGCAAYNRWKQDNENNYLTQEEYDLLKEELM